MSSRRSDRCAGRARDFRGLTWLWTDGLLNGLDRLCLCCKRNCLVGLFLPGSFLLDVDIGGIAALKLGSLGYARPLRSGYRRLNILPLQTLDFNLDVAESLFVVPNLLRHKLFVPRIEVRHEFWNQIGMGEPAGQAFRSRAGDLAFFGITGARTLRGPSIWAKGCAVPVKTVA